MRAGYLVLPFLAFFFLVFGLASHATLLEFQWVSYVLFSLAGLLLVSWIFLESSGLQERFSRRSSRQGLGAMVNVLLGIAIVVGLSFLSSKPRFNPSVDLTRDQVNTLSEQSKNVIDQLNKANVNVTALAFFGDEMTKAKFRSLAELYIFAGAPLDVTYIDPNIDPMKALAENVTTDGTVILKAGEQDARVTTFTEEKLTNGLMKILKPSDKTVYFLAGHGERDIESEDIEGYKLAKMELESERYNVKQLKLLEVDAIPEDADLLIIAGPKYDFSEQELKMLDSYLQQARTLLVMLDAMNPLDRLTKFLSRYGFQYNNDLLILHPEDGRIQTIGMQNVAIVSEFDDFSPVTSQFAERGAVDVLLENARSISLIEDNETGAQLTVLGRAHNGNFRVTDVKSAADLSNLDDSRIVLGNEPVLVSANLQVGGDKLASASDRSGDQEKSDSHPEMESQSAKELRLIAFGSSELATNLWLQRGMQNLDLFVNTVNYLLQDEDYITIRAKDVTDASLQLSSLSSQFNLMFLVWIYPFLFLGYGIFHWMKRRRA